MSEKQCCSSTSRAGAVGVAAIAAGIGGAAWVRSWEATRKERQRKWPGDELVGKDAETVTHAITVHATPLDIWPWLIQLGQDRGGFYSYTWLENLVGCRMRNAKNIVQEFQHRTVGDSVWMAPPKRYKGAARMTVAQIVPERALVLVDPGNPRLTLAGAHDGTWAFYLEPIDETRTRFIARGRSRRPSSMFWRIAHFIMERKMMLTIKQNAEQGTANAARSRPYKASA